MRETHRDYAQPWRPWALRAALAIGGRLPAWPSLHPDVIVAAACRQERLADFGEPDVREPLAVLCRSIEDEARLHALGRFAIRTRLEGTLRNRLRAQELYGNNPEILSTPVAAPIVITGRQRTGTTFLHRLLAAHPDLRGLRSWEGLNPAPLRGRDERGQRIRDAQRSERALAWLAPDFFAVHPVQAKGYEEEVLLLDMSLLSTVPEAILRVPSFGEWLEAQDQRPAYETLRRMLQLLQWQEGPDRWVLKTPHHLEWLDVLFDVFPDARVVHTHRDPVVTTASFLSMLAHGRGVMSDDIDPVEIGRHWLRKLGRMVERAAAVRASHPDRFLDVDYDDLAADPVGQVRRILAWAEVPVDTAAQALVQAEAARSDKHRFGRHVYDLADFGLTPGQVTAALGPGGISPRGSPRT